MSSNSTPSNDGLTPGPDRDASAPRPHEDPTPPDVAREAVPSHEPAAPAAVPTAAPASEPAPVTGSVRRPKTTGLAKGEPTPGVAKVDPIMVVDNVTRRFGGLTAVDVEHLEIPRNAITALIGPNGAGKTTLFNLLCGFDKPNSGTWEFDGKRLSGIPAFKVARMGQVRTFQLTKALSLLTVLENMKLGATGQRGERFWTSFVPGFWRTQERENEQKARELLARFKLDAKADDFAASLSGGQRKLLEMARALMSDPSFVMLDEPMAGVNPALTESLLDHILDLKDLGMTVLFVEHDMHMVRHIADWVVVMAEGKVVAEGPPDTVMEDQAVIDAYLGSHQDVDLGVVTGRIEGELGAEGRELLEEIHEEQEHSIDEANKETR
ncbi:amino acid/amide ABC transporter ATP-binding protein 1 (HAAT family) [Microbacterium sp. BK668]|nr:amino acid/amide ABC transporter ATP-binding protein 1 (HAAT family) [Microbacterium sp. BK668]